jgi:transcriptional regulator with XRE-family HTH domain
MSDSPGKRAYGRGEIDTKTRERIRGWVVHEMNRRGIVSIREAARKIGVSHTYLTRVLGGDTTPGIEFLLRVHRKWHISLDILCDEDPPPTKLERW